LDRGSGGDLSGGRGGPRHRLRVEGGRGDQQHQGARPRDVQEGHRRRRPRGTGRRLVTRRIAVGALAIWVALAFAGPGWGQSAPPRPRPARPSSTAPAPRPDAAAADGRSGPVTVDADQLENIQKEGLVVFTGN